MKIKTLMVVGLAFMVGVINSMAQNGFSQFATWGTAVNSGTNWAIIPGEFAAQFNSSQGRPVSPIPVLTFLSMRAAAVTAVTLQSYYSTNRTSIAYTNTPGLTSTNFVLSTNNFAAGQWVVIHHTQLNDRISDEALLVSSIGTQTATNAASGVIYNSMIFTTPPIQLVSLGDQIYQETAGALISVTTNTLPTSFVGNGILSGQRETPLLLVLSSTGVGTNTIDAANSTFVP